MTRRAGNGRIGIALAAAFLLFLQGVLGATANAVSFAGPTDISGHPLCLSVDGTGHDPAAMPDCCTLACMAAAPWLPPSANGDLVQRYRASIHLANTLPRPQIFDRQDDYEPGRPRAPPRLG